MNPLRIIFLVLCCLATVVISIGAFFVFPSFALNGEAGHGKEIAWNGGVVKVVDFSGLPGIHLYHVGFHRPDERPELLFVPHQYEPSLTVTADGQLRAVIQIEGSLPAVPREGEQVEMQQGTVKVVQRNSTRGKTYFVELYRGGELRASLLDMGDSKPRLVVDEDGVLTVIAEYPAGHEEEDVDPLQRRSRKPTS